MIDEETLSYYVVHRNGETKKELLRDHIKKALSHLDEFDSSRINEYATRHLRIRNLRELLKYAIIFHDIGKVFFQPPKHIRRSDETEYLSFRGHEFISALLADLFLSRKLGKQHEINHTPVTFSVFYHHHAMNPKTRQIGIAPLKPQDKQYKDRIYKVLSGFLDREEREILPDCLNTFINKISEPNFVERLKSKLYNEVLLNAKNHAIGKTSFLLLDCLIACDYMAAQDREEGSSTFFHTLSEFYKTWMRKT